MLNEVNILESLNEYYQKQVWKNSSKKHLCPALQYVMTQCLAAQDRSPFFIFDIMNEILKHPKLMDF